MGLFKNIFSKKNTKKPVVTATEDIADDYDSLKYVETLCNNSMAIEKAKLEEEKRMLKNISLLDQYKKYDVVNPKDVEDIENLMEKYTTLGREKESLKSDLLLNEKKYEKLKKYEKNMDQIIADIKETEDEKEKVELDLKYLKAQQGALKYEEHTILERLKGLQKLMYVVLGIACIIAVIFTILFFVLEEVIIIPCVVVSSAIVCWMGWVYLVERDQKGEVEANKIKQDKTIKLINKVKIKLVNAEADLMAYYKKYEVNSSVTLKNKWAVYKQTKNKRFQYNEVFTDYFDIYEKIEKILDKYHIKFEDEMSVLKELTDKKEKMKLKEITEADVANSKNRISKFSEDLDDIVKKLKMLRKNELEDSSVAKVIDTFFSQMEEEE